MSRTPSPTWLRVNIRLYPYVEEIRIQLTSRLRDGSGFRNHLLKHQHYLPFAEVEGFGPPCHALHTTSDFQNQRIRPLCHTSKIAEMEGFGPPCHALHTTSGLANQRNRPLCHISFSVSSEGIEPPPQKP